jgi:tetratricopeptide (TPR) repeat protein
VFAETDEQGAGTRSVTRLTDQLFFGRLSIGTVSPPDPESSVRWQLLCLDALKLLADPSPGHRQNRLATSLALQAEQQQDWLSAAKWRTLEQQQFPDYWPAYEKAVDAWLAADRPQEAEKALRRAGEQFPNDYRPTLLSARVQEERGHHAKAISLIRAGCERFPSARALRIRAALLLSEHGHADDAQNFILPLLTKSLEDFSILHDLARAAERRGDWNDAYRWWNFAREHFPTHPLGHTGAAAALRQLGRHTDSNKLLKSALETIPHEFGPLHDLGRSAEEQRDWVTADSVWSLARVRFPDQLLGYTGGAVALRELGQPGKANDVLLAAIERFPGEFGPLHDVARTAERQQDWEAANRWWAVSRQQFPDMALGYTAGASVLGRLEVTSVNVVENLV